MKEGSLLPEKAVVGKSTIDPQLLDSSDWIQAKSFGDLDTALKIVNSTWISSTKKEEDLKRLFKDPMTIIITQPGTSGFNSLPIALAKKLHDEYGPEFINGDKVFISSHSSASKLIPSYQRIFEPRQYTPKDPKKLLNALENRNVVIVEDILTTGGSVAKFQKTLNHLGIPVRGVVSLLGNSRLRIDEKTSQTLRSALTDKQIQIKDSSFIEGMTRTEAGFLIRSLNQVKSEKKIKEFSDKFLKLVDSEKSKADKLKSIRFDHNLKNITTNINTSDNTSNFSHKELLKQFSGQVIENQKNKLDSQKEKLAIIAFQGMKIRVEFSSQKDRGQFIKNSIFSDIAKVTHIDDALIAATLNNTIIKSGKDINETDKRLSNSFDQFKSIDPEKHSFMMLTKKDYSKPVIFDLKSHSAREAVLKQIDVLRIEDLKATRLNNFNNITIKASREGQIVTTNIKDALRTKILSFQQEQKANMSKTPDPHQVKKPATKKDNIDMGLSR